MRATKIRLLFAVFSVCFVVFYFRSVSSCSATSSDDCTKLVGESHPDLNLRFCVCSTNNGKDRDGGAGGAGGASAPPLFSQKIFIN